MKTTIFVPGFFALLAFSEAQGQPEGETISGFQCVGINIPGLHLTQDDLRTGAGFPWILDAPRNDGKGVARVSGIIYVAWPLSVENGFVKAMSYGGTIGWLKQTPSVLCGERMERPEAVLYGRVRMVGSCFISIPALASITEVKVAADTFIEAPLRCIPAVRTAVLASALEAGSQAHDLRRMRLFGEKAEALPSGLCAANRFLSRGGGGARLPSADPEAGRANSRSMK